MNKKEIQYLTETIAKNERVIACCQQAMINFSVMLRDTSFDPALLEQIGEPIAGIIGMVYNDIKNAMPRINENRARDEELRELKQELQRLRSMNLFQRILKR